MRQLPFHFFSGGVRMQSIGVSIRYSKTVYRHNRRFIQRRKLTVVRTIQNGVEKTTTWDELLYEL